MYQLVTGTYSLDGATYKSFGIQCGDVLFEDVDMDKQAVERLVALCNSEELDVAHLADVVMDFVSACL